MRWLVVPMVFACTAAAAGWWLGGRIGVALAGTAPAYDHQVAQHLASLHVPPERDSYFMYDLNELGDARAQAVQLAETLPVAERERQYIGLTGADPVHAIDVLRQTGDLAADERYPHATLIVVAPPAQRYAFTEAAMSLGIELAYVPYP